MLRWAAALMAYISFIATFLRFPFLFMLDFQNMNLSSIGYILIDFFLIELRQHTYKSLMGWNGCTGLHYHLFLCESFFLREILPASVLCLWNIHLLWGLELLYLSWCLELLKVLYSDAWNVKWYNHFEITVWQFLKKLNTYLSYDAAVLTPGNWPKSKNENICLHKDMHVNVQSRIIHNSQNYK